MFRLIADEALKLTDAEVTFVAVPTEDDVPTSDIRELLVVETDGADTTSAEAQTIPVMGTPIGQAFLQRTPRRLDGIDLDIDGIDSRRPALVLPLRTTDTVAGVLVALRDNGAQPFSDEQLDMMAAFVDEAALAWQLATSQRRMREVDVLTDRDRIPRDLHDHVIQRLFAVGLALQGTVPRALQPKYNNGSQILSTTCKASSRRSELRSSTCTAHPRKVSDCVSGSMRRSRSSPAPICAPRFNSPARCRWSMLHWPTTSNELRCVWSVRKITPVASTITPITSQLNRSIRVVFTIRSNGIFPPEFVLP